jgi:hypothetical protein
MGGLGRRLDGTQRGRAIYSGRHGRMPEYECKKWNNTIKLEFWSKLLVQCYEN